MKTLLAVIFTLVYSTQAFSQNLVINPDNKYYETSKVLENDTTGLNSALISRLNDLNYKNVVKLKNGPSAEGFTSHLVGGIGNVEITYKAKYELKSGRYNITLTNFILTDKNGSNTLESLNGLVRNKWLKIINSKTPEILNQLLGLPENE